MRNFLKQKSFSIFTLVFMLVTVIYSNIMAADGALDSSFGIEGIVTSTNENGGSSVAIQSDGKIVMSGGYAVMRYKNDGSLDTSFGTDGKITDEDMIKNDLTIQSDGKIVVAGSVNKAFSPEGIFAVARYNSDGSLDKSFGTDGKVTTDLDIKGKNAVAIQSDGKILVTGTARMISYDIALIRYNINGSLDTAFGTDGKIITEIGNASDYGNAVAIQSDGRIVVAGEASENFAVVRYNSDGSLDTNFGTEGKVTTNIGTDDHGKALAIQSDGKIVVAGHMSGHFEIARYNSNGSLDTSFGNEGKVTTLFEGSYKTAQANALAIQSDGKIVVTGNVKSGSPPYVMINSIHFINDSSDIIVKDNHEQFKEAL